VENSFSGKQARRSLQNLLIEPFKQVRFGLYVLAITICFLLISTILMINSFFEQYNHVLSIFNVVDPHLRWEFITDSVFHENIFRLFLCFSIFVIILFSTVIKLTHRFYGPIISINRFTEELKRGNYSARIYLRKKDELQDLAKHLNELAEVLEKKNR